MQKVIASIFAPFIIAVVIRLLLAIIGGILHLLGAHSAGGHIGDFETFSWDDSYGFWIIVMIATFIAEMAIWDDDGL